MNAIISRAEKTYIEEGCREGMREDGRGPIDFRTIFVENNIMPHVNGSARVKIADSVDVLCTVKVYIYIAFDTSTASAKINLISPCKILDGNCPANTSRAR